ncbi:sodium- and chloride-dependent betaine transporter-like [Ylistrum balloti]|uniref:sodium- and chloride-dependent betaine transporter-like n=1 Tax=Ylistrum balloti TaxID=509963 RepID=UPI002905C649|nr:sodium- and chloride-dependent betaine transporter-like [Ylistrum balloti]
MESANLYHNDEEVEMNLCKGEKEDSKTHEDISELKRDVWANKIEYLLSLIGYTVGLGSVWRFPYLCMKNGGGAFLVPFFLFTVLCGFPLYVIEMTVGQFSGRSAMVAWGLCPLLEGMGYAMVLLGTTVTWYYGLIVAWVLLYLGYSFFPTQPWSTCDNEWNTDRCVVLRTGYSDPNNSSGYHELSNSTRMYGVSNVSVDFSGSLSNKSTQIQQDFYPTAATEFWRYKILNESSGIEDWGSIQWHLVIALIFSYTSTFLCIIKGVKSVGKVVYVTVIGPFVLLIVILIRSLCLPGSFDGVLMYLAPDFSRLWHFQVWLEAALQVFYSLGPIWGGVVTMASYQKFHGNLLRSTMLIVAVDTFSNFLCGLVVFSIMGVLAYEANLSIEEVAESGPGLVFLVYPEVLARMPLPQLWAVIFFFLLFTIGLDSQFGVLEATISGFADMYPRFLGKKKPHLIVFFYVLFLLTGIIFATQGGVYLFQFIDWYLSVFCIFILSFLECMIAGWLYGAERFSRDIELMTGKKASVLIRISWCILTPLVMMMALVTVVIKFEPPIYKGYKYPEYLGIVGIVLALICVIPVPFIACKRLLQTPGTIKERMAILVTPSREWYPHDKEERLTYQMYKYKGGIRRRIRENLCGSRD